MTDMTMLAIRQVADAKDQNLVRACCDIWLEASKRGHDFVPVGFWEERYPEMRDRYLPESRLVVAERDGIVGFAATMGDCLEALFVAPEHWGAGVGGLLLAETKRSRSRMTLSVYAKNRRAAAFYMRRGFHKSGRGICPHTGEEELHLLWLAG